MSLDAHDMEILIKTVYLEARGEPPEGQAAVVNVIRNRANLNKEYWGGSKIADVCLKSGQFECWNSGEPNIDAQSPAYKNVENLVNNVINNGEYGSLNDGPFCGSDHYNNPNKEGYPPWTENCDRTVKIGEHQFYKTKPGH